jgi:site-specific DNA recombinase
MRKCAIYARYSSDLQRESSIEDQFRRCREYARKNEWAVAENFVMADRALSGAAMAGREGLQRLLEAAQGKPRPFDCLLIEDTSRQARDLADALRTTAILEFYGVAVVSVTQGIDSPQANARQLITLHGMVDEQYLTGLRDKVHRGQHGRVLKGMIPGGRCYGYRNIPIEDRSRTGKYGRFAVLGVRAEIDDNEAKVVIWIFELYAGGLGLAQIARRLNQLGIPSPIPAKNRLYRAWSRYTIREMLHNERYRGVLVWNRTKKVRHRSSETKRVLERSMPIFHRFLTPFHSPSISRRDRNCKR